MNARLNVSAQTAQRDLPAPTPALSNTGPAKIYAWKASSQDELDEGLVITNEIMSEPGELEAIMAAWAEVERGEYTEGVEAVRALRPRE